VHSYRLRWCGARSPEQWPVGLPEPLPACEQHAGYLSEILSWQRRALAVILERYGDETAAMFERSEHWREARVGRLRGGGNIGEENAAWASFAEAELMFISEGRTRGLPKPRLADKWMDDGEFVHYRIAGPAAEALRLVRGAQDLPEWVAAEEERLLPRLEMYHSIGAACEAGRIYSAAPEGRGNAVVLFYIANNRQILPLCIRLAVKGGYSVYTPDDNTWSWNAAKMSYCQAELESHLVYRLYAQTVLPAAVMHAITYRCLSLHHPLRQLLRPHLRHHLRHH